MAERSASSPNDAAIPRFKASFLRPRYWLRWLLMGVIVVVAFLPRAIRDALTDGFGTLVFRFNHKRRRWALINIGMCFPEMTPAQRTDLAHRHFQAQYLVLLDLPVLLLGSARHLQRLIQIEGGEHIEQVRGAGKAAIVLTGHSSAVDVGVIGLSQTYHLVGFYNTFKDEWLDWLWFRVRAQYGNHPIARTGGFRPLIRGARAGSVIYYVADEDLGEGRTVFADFFGQKKATIGVLGRLANACNGAVIPSYTAYDKRTRRYTVHLLPPMSGELGVSPESDAALMNAELEELIRLSPEQYMWTLRLFKTRPDGEPSPYKKPPPEVVAETGSDDAQS